MIDLDTRREEALINLHKQFAELYKAIGEMSERIAALEKAVDAVMNAATVRVALNGLRIQQGQPNRADKD